MGRLLPPRCRAATVRGRSCAATGRSRSPTGPTREEVATVVEERGLVTGHGDFVDSRLHVADRLLVERDRSLEVLERLTRLDFGTDKSVVVLHRGAARTDEVEVRTERRAGRSAHTTRDGRLSRRGRCRQENSTDR